MVVVVWLEGYYQVFVSLVVVGGGEYCFQFVWVMVVVVDDVYFGIVGGGYFVQIIEVVIDIGEVFQCVCDCVWCYVQLLVYRGGSQCVEYVVFVWQCQYYFLVGVLWQVQGEVYV